jgi:hypothetical protein
MELTGTTEKPEELFLTVNCKSVLAVCNLLTFLCPYCPIRISTDKNAFHHHLSTFHTQFLRHSYNTRRRLFPRNVHHHTLLPSLFNTAANDDVVRSWSNSSKQMYSSYSAIVLGYVRVDNYVDGTSFNFCPVCYQVFDLEEEDSDIKDHLKEKHVLVRIEKTNRRDFEFFRVCPGPACD